MGTHNLRARVRWTDDLVVHYSTRPRRGGEHSVASPSTNYSSTHSQFTNQIYLNEPLLKLIPLWVFTRGGTVSGSTARKPQQLKPANRVRFPAGLLPHFACGNHSVRCLWSAGFFRDIPFLPPLHSDTAPYSLHFSSALKNLSTPHRWGGGDELVNTGMHGEEKRSECARSFERESQLRNETNVETHLRGICVSVYVKGGREINTCYCSARATRGFVYLPGPSGFPQRQMSCVMLVTYESENASSCPDVTSPNVIPRAADFVDRNENERMGNRDEVKQEISAMKKECGENWEAVQVLTHAITSEDSQQLCGIGVAQSAVLKAVGNTTPPPLACDGHSSWHKYQHQFEIVATLNGYSCILLSPDILPDLFTEITRSGAKITKLASLYLVSRSAAADGNYGVAKVAKRGEITFRDAEIDTLHPAPPSFTKTCLLQRTQEFNTRQAKPSRFSGSDFSALFRGQSVYLDVQALAALQRPEKRAVRCDYAYDDVASSLRTSRDEQRATWLMDLPSTRGSGRTGKLVLGRGWEQLVAGCWNVDQSISRSRHEISSPRRARIAITLFDQALIAERVTKQIAASCVLLPLGREKNSQGLKFRLIWIRIVLLYISFRTPIPMRVFEVNMERRRNEGAGETGDTRENPPTNGIVRHDSHLRKCGMVQGTCNCPEVVQDTCNCPEVVQGTCNCPEVAQDTCNCPEVVQYTCNCPEVVQGTCNCPEVVQGTCNCPEVVQDTCNCPEVVQGPCNCPEVVQGTCNCPEVVQGTCNCPEVVQDTCNCPEVVHGTCNCPEVVQDTCNCPEVVQDTCNCPEVVQDTCNCPEVVQDTCNCPEVVQGTCNCPEVVQGPCNCPEVVQGTCNCPEVVQDTCNCPEVVQGTCNCPEVAQDTCNCPEVVQYTCNCPEVVQGTCNCPEVVQDTCNCPEVVQDTCNCPEVVQGTCNGPEVVQGTCNCPEVVQGTCNSPEVVQGTCNCPEVVQGPCNCPEVVQGTCNCPEVAQDTCNCPEVVQYTCNCPEVVQGTCNCPEVVQDTCNCPEVVQGTCNCPEVVQGTCNCPEVVQGTCNCPEVVQYTCNCPEVVQGTCNCPEVVQLTYNCPEVVQDTYKLKVDNPSQRSDASISSPGEEFYTHYNNTTYQRSPSRAPLPQHFVLDLSVCLSEDPHQDEAIKMQRGVSLVAFRLNTQPPATDCIIQGEKKVFVISYPLPPLSSEGITPLPYVTEFAVGPKAVKYAQYITPLRWVKGSEYEAAPECKSGNNGRSPSKPPRPTASSDTIPTYENPGAVQPARVRFPTLPPQPGFRGFPESLQADDGSLIPAMTDDLPVHLLTDLPVSLITLLRGAAVAERLACSPPTKANRVQSPAGSPDSHMAIVPDDAVGRRIFSGISRFLRPFIPAPLNTHLNHPYRLSRPRC
ncbi:hypothetical protein PR048_024241 [Dryococelus australis]|uniref:Uncharacterized protein n=1 Tax=Dryococelus australis TaxID=614101 RepID=A0ABQ9GN18_9NEOP|nr:hypothetical protein PR048_024241 [Dryococelus australis]